MSRERILMALVGGTAGDAHLAGCYPGALGHLYSPGGQRGPWPFLPYALDNGAFPAWEKGAAQP